MRRRGPVTRVRYERESPGELVHVDVKKVARIPDGGGWRALGRGGDPYGGRSAPDPRACTSPSTTSAGSPTPSCCPTRRRRLRGVHGPLPAVLRGMGVRVGRVMTDNGPGYRSGELNALLESEGVRHTYTRPYSPWQNGKVERMNRTLAQEWQYGRAWECEADRAEALPAYIERYNWDRPHSACGGLPPMSRIVSVNNLLAHKKLGGSALARLSP